MRSIMKKTALNNIHHEAGAKMVPFAGYEMPVVYTSIQEEHMAVREKAGIFDVSHMGQFLVRGKDAKKLVQFVTTNNVSKLKPGNAQYSCLPNKKGGIVDDLIVYRLYHEDEKVREYLLVVNAANIKKDFDWIEKNNDFDASLTDLSDEYALIAVQGPKAQAWLQKLTETDLSEIPFYEFRIGQIGPSENVIISNTGYTGSGGFELYIKNDIAADIWKLLMEHADEFGAVPCGLGARDTLRLEKGYCLYGNDLSDETSPIEAGLSWVVKTKIKSEFISKELFAKQKKEGVAKKLTGFILDSRRVPRNGYKIFTEDEQKEIGVVTSGTQSPMLGKPIGMGYIDKEYLEEGQKIKIHIGRKMHEATIKKPPFV